MPLAGDPPRPVVRQGDVNAVRLLDEAFSVRAGEGKVSPRVPSSETGTGVSAGGLENKLEKKSLPHDARPAGGGIVRVVVYIVLPLVVEQKLLHMRLGTDARGTAD